MTQELKDLDDLKAELGEGCYTDGCGETKERARATIEQLEAEIARLREGLEQIEGKSRLGGDCLGNSPPNFKSCQNSFYMLADLCRALLEPSK